MSKIYIQFQKVLLFFAKLFSSEKSNGQPPCETHVLTGEMALHKDYMEGMVKEYLRQKSMSRMDALTAPIVIPVVVHVLWNQIEQNISDAQVLSQIDALNLSFSASNSDIVNVPDCFKPFIGNPNIQFALARRDPKGNPTTGIIRKQTSVTSFSSDGNVCFSAMGGDDIWDHTQYLNIWVCNKTGAAGYSAYPWSGNPSTDGIIIGFNWFGTTGYLPNNWSYLKGRTCVHEVGHFFGLAHIWGDAPCGDDLVADTPTQAAANGGNPSWPHVTCNNGPNGDMFMNYMDYTDDNCRVFFTAGQVQRMLGYLHTTRAALLTSLGSTDPSSPPPPPPTCPVPTGLISSQISSFGARLSWSNMGASSYKVMYKGAQSSTWATATVTTNYYLLTGLLPSTIYQFQVQSLCGSVSSAFSIVSSFKTLRKVH